jgi:hypothetical protein
MQHINLSQIIPLLVPLVILELALMVFGLFDLVRREKTRGPKWVWAVVIVLFNLIGPIIYFIFGRGEE